jgi:dipeptidyl-peptidase-4
VHKTGRRLRPFLLVGTMFAIVFFPASSFSQAAPQSAVSKPRKPLTIEAIYGQPGLSGRLASGLAWTPDSKQIAFFESRGDGKDARQEVSTMNAATGTRHLLIATDKLATILPPQPYPLRQRTGAARHPPASFEFAPDGTAILFRGQTSVVWFDLKSQTARTLVSGKEMLTDEKISPDGHWVSFVRGYNVWIVSTSGGDARAMTTGGSEALRKGHLDWVYPEELEIGSGYWWAPDSSAIAYLELDEHAVTKYTIQNNIDDLTEEETDRYPRAGEANPVARVFVQPIAGGEPRAMDIGSDKEILIPRVDWLPDSKRLAIQRLARVANVLELTIADASSGEAHVVLTERSKRWVDVTDILWFSKDSSRFIWGSARSGYQHLYAYRTNGAEVAQITHGDWDVESLDGVDENRGLIYFTATEQGPMERQIYRVDMDGSGFTRVSRDAGWHFADFSPDASAFIDTHSSVMKPPQQELVGGDGKQIAVIHESSREVENYGLSPVEFLKVKASDSTLLNTSMIKPLNFDSSKKYPVIVYTYGGPSQVVRNMWMGGTFLFNQFMSQKGFVIFSVDNHGSMGRGRAFEETLYHNIGGQELADQRAGVAYLRTLPYVDGQRIGIWGWSYGGLMTLLALFEAPQDFKVGFAGAPASDWRQYDSIVSERILGLPKDDPEAYRRASPVNFVKGLEGKLMIGQGTGDDNVHLVNTMLVLNEAIKYNKDIEVVLLPGRGHPASDPAGRIYLMKRVAAFFEKNLQGN